MRYSGLIRNDLAAAPGISVSFFTQGCPHRCKGCHNPETWDFEKGQEFTPDILQEILEALIDNGISRSLCIMGGEPLCEENTLLVLMILQYVKRHLPRTPVYIWTGYYYEQLMKKSDPKVKSILELTDYLIDGPYIESLRDVSLTMCGSSNQSIINLKELRNEKNTC